MPTSQNFKTTFKYILTCIFLSLRAELLFNLCYEIPCICFQEESQYTSFGKKDICNISYPFAKLLSHEIHQANPNTKVQWYLTWGRPNGDAERCDQIPQVCTFDGMNYKTYILSIPIKTYTMRKNLPKTLDQLIFCKYTLVFSKCSQIY